jgi:hypothetical protein
MNKRTFDRWAATAGIDRKVSGKLWGALQQVQGKYEGFEGLTAYIPGQGVLLSQRVFAQKVDQLLAAPSELGPTLKLHVQKLAQTTTEGLTAKNTAPSEQATASGQTAEQPDRLLTRADFIQWTRRSGGSAEAAAALWWRLRDAADRPDGRYAGLMPGNTDAERRLSLRAFTEGATGQLKDEWNIGPLMRQTMNKLLGRPDNNED